MDCQLVTGLFGSKLLQKVSKRRRNTVLLYFRQFNRSRFQIG